MADALDIIPEGIGRVINRVEHLIEKTTDATDLMAGYVGVMMDASDRAFINEADPTTGVPWAPLTKNTADRVVRGSRRGEHPILTVTGALRKIQGDHGPLFAAVGSPLVYATTMHFGAKRGQFGTAAGAYTFDGESISPRSIPIPFGDIDPRPFLGLGEDDIDEMLDLTDQFFGGI